MTFTTTFNPGPSQISDATKADIQTAVQERWLEISHRSPQFSAISTQCVTELKKLLGVPKDYRVFYLDSASQAWHSILCNVVATNSFHLINGAFSGKFAKAARALSKPAEVSEVAWGQQHDFSDLEIPVRAELVTVCANETSTGVSLRPNDLQHLRKKCENTLLAVDITSCAGAVDLPIDQADLWYFSVQKCFGLPAGLGVLIVSPRAYQRSLELAEQGQNLAGQWQWSALEKPMVEKNHQTPQTPNVLNIYLLAAQAQRWNQAGGLPAQVQATEQKMNLLSGWVEAHPDLDFYVADPAHRSSTVLTIKADRAVVAALHQRAEAAGIKLGGGYGKTKKDVFRVANFPALSKDDITHLMQVLE